MTCICAIAKDGVVYMAADSSMSNGFDSTMSPRKKIFKVGDFLIGICGSMKMGQLLNMAWTPPVRVIGDNEDKYIYIDVMKSIKKMFADNEWESGGDSPYSGGNFIFGYNGKIYEALPDYSILEYPDGFIAIGSGGYHAMAVMDALSAMTTDGPPEHIMSEAIRVASKYVVSVGGPVSYISSED